MDKIQAINNFFNGYASAYLAGTTPDEKDAPFPRITYEASVGEFNSPTLMPVSLWDRSTSWAKIMKIALQMQSDLDGGKLVRYDGGAVWIKPGTPFMQTMADSDDTIRRIYINLETEYIGG